MNNQPELLKQFTCTSSLILLTHPQLKEDLDGYFEILKIFDSKGTEVWNAGQKQIILNENNPDNIKNIDMATFDIVFKEPQKFTITRLKEIFIQKRLLIRPTDKYEYSITDIRVSKKIHPDEPLEKYPDPVTKEHIGKTFENPGASVSQKLVKPPTYPYTVDVSLPNGVELSAYKDYAGIEKVKIKYVSSN